MGPWLPHLNFPTFQFDKTDIIENILLPFLKNWKQINMPLNLLIRVHLHKASACQDMQRRAIICREGRNERGRRV